jgi:multicomponent Na+:H+ antiporter subunit F
MTLQSLAAVVILPLLSLAIIMTFVRLVRGPSLPDRVVALDLMATIGIGFIAVYAVATDQPVFLDVGTVLALISFLGTVAFARYIERRAKGTES